LPFPKFFACFCCVGKDRLQSPNIGIFPGRENDRQEATTGNYSSNSWTQWNQKSDDIQITTLQLGMFLCKKQGKWWIDNGLMYTQLLIFIKCQEARVKIVYCLKQFSVHQLPPLAIRCKRHPW
jgi:hypothetical protein